MPFGPCQSSFFLCYKSFMKRLDNHPRFGYYISTGDWFSSVLGGSVPTVENNRVWGVCREGPELSNLNNTRDISNKCSVARDRRGIGLKSIIGKVRM